MDQKMMIMVQNSFALCSNIIPETNKCFEDTDMHSCPHMLNIINLVARSQRLNDSKVLLKALSKYYSNMYKDENAKLNREKLFTLINLNFPFIGASPGEIIYCDCCGKGCLEVECQYDLTY
ncbi:Hypothetical protein CINCED_3A009559, partial [Cinara cedri]